MNQKNRNIKAWLLCLAMLTVAIGWLTACGHPELTLSSEGSVSLPIAEKIEEEQQGADGNTKKTKQEVPKETALSTTDSWYVQVSGAVLHPGVYQVAPDSRVFQLIELAGGLTAEAEAAAINQAVRLRDGQQLYVPTRDEVAARGAGATLDAVTAEGGTALLENGNGAADPGAGSGRININTATAEQLCTLPGIGEAKAADIIAYRTQNGGFTDPTQLMEIAGIKKGVYENIKDRIDIQ
ncbi:MAG: helix-hairpin-helix domain-containing protein [Eubacteriales bacterium]|nr:helix-hairpin-helix domain-containing protein [Eubacteriales bacterium]